MYVVTVSQFLLRSLDMAIFHKAFENDYLYLDVFFMHITNLKLYKKYNVIFEPIIFAGLVIILRPS